MYQTNTYENIEHVQNNLKTSREQMVSFIVNLMQFHLLMGNSNCPQIFVVILMSIIILFDII